MRKLDLIAQIVCEARDDSISNFDGFFSGKYNGLNARFAKNLYDKMDENSKSSVELLIPLFIDETLTIFLQLLDENHDKGVLDLILTSEKNTGSVYEEIEALEPEYLAAGGWVEKYSSQRVTANKG